MKILYVILTCEKYLETRVKWQKETWLKEPGIDYIHLDGGNVYNDAPKTYIDFFISLADVEGLHVDYYDWFFFCDDDTFVFTDKLECALMRQNLLGTEIYKGKDNAPVMMGFCGGTFDIHSLKIVWCSGGAGIALNRSAVKAIQMHLRNTPRPLVTHETDISLAIWATMATENLTVIDNKRFSPFNPFDAKQQGLEDCITYHYCTENDFIRLSR